MPQSGGCYLGPPAVRSITVIPADERVRTIRLDVTRYLVYRQGEWGFYVTLDAIEADGVELGIYFMNRHVPTLNPRWTSLKSGEGFAVGLERLDGSEEDVVITFERVEGPQAILEFELPDGAKLEQVEDDDVGSPDD